MASPRKPRPRPVRTLLAAAALSLLPQGPAAALEDVLLELVLAVDCSSSVNGEEFALQMQGIAGAFEDPAVLAVLERNGGSGIAVSLLQWSSAGSQAEAIGWTRIDGIADALAFADRVRATERLVVGGATALSSAIDTAVLWTQTNRFRGARVVIDISGDGRGNDGGSPAISRALANRAGVTINGLAILNEEPQLAGYYLAGVVGGPGAFLLTAEDFDDFAVAMRRKLYFEIVGPPIAQIPQDIPPHAPQIARFPAKY
ncbi:MAG: DUF1194 domain-containing protein [Kiloniellaceae bacterium]